MTPNAEFLAMAALGLVIVLLIWIVRLEMRLGKMLKGKNAETLEDTIADLLERAKRAEERQDRTARSLENLDERMKRGITNVEMVRFNAFREGGSQSFAAALLTEDGDGIVISTLHARERTGVFGKPIKNWKSEYELSAEEKEAIKRSRP